MLVSSPDQQEYAQECSSGGRNQRATERGATSRSNAPKCLATKPVSSGRTNDGTMPLRFSRRR